MKNSKAYLVPVLFGILMMVAGFSMKTPGNLLTTYESLNGKTSEYGVFDKTLTTIDEYVNGDAYNFEIGASLIAGKTAGTMAEKGLLITGGLLCLCVGCTMFVITEEQTAAAAAATPSVPAVPEPPAASAE